MNSGNQLPNLDKIFRDDDEPDFLPSGGLNLAAIFGLQVKQPEYHSSLKQVPKTSSSPRNLTQQVSSKTEVIIAKAVHAFKLQNGVYASMGKLGMALTGNTMTKVYQIILYKSKQEHVSTVTVTHDFLYVMQPNNYSSYYDTSKENWSILFENNDICIEFAREVGLARYFSKDGRIENVLYQDLSPANKDSVAKGGDNVSVKYFISSEITQPFKSNLTASQTMTVEISTDDNWERTLLGSTKGLKRVLILPPNKQISLGPGFPKEKDVMLEIEVIDIKTPEDLTQTRKSASGKASIISRMAKMGQSMLPNIPVSTTTDSEDTEDDIPHKSPRHKKLEPLEEGLQKKHSLQESIEEASKNPHKALKPKGDASVTNTCKPFVPTSTFTPQWSSTQVQPNFVTLDGQVYSLQPQTVTPTISTVLDPGLNMLLSESRLTNAELRMGMSKIADNVQKLLDKFHVLELQNATSPIKDKATLDATLKMLLTMSASQTKEKESQLQKSSNLTVNDDLTEQNDMRNRVDELKTELAKSKEQIMELEAQKLSLANANENLCKNVQELETSLGITNNVLIKMKQDLEEAKKLNNKCEEQKIILEDRISKLLEQYKAVEKNASSMEVKDNENKNKEVKRIMNKIYHTLLDKFVDESYPTHYIRSMIANTIKNVTLHVLYNANEQKNWEPESISSKTVEDTDVTGTIKKELESSGSSSHTIEPQKQPQVSGNTTIHISSVLQNEPPPIPPIDTEDDSDWLH